MVKHCQGGFNDSTPNRLARGFLEIILTRIRAAFRCPTRLLWYP